MLCEGQHGPDIVLNLTGLALNCKIFSLNIFASYILSTQIHRSRLHSSCLRVWMLVYQPCKRLSNHVGIHAYTRVCTFLLYTKFQLQILEPQSSGALGGLQSLGLSKLGPLEAGSQSARALGTQSVLCWFPRAQGSKSLHRKDVEVRWWLNC